MPKKNSKLKRIAKIHKVTIHPNRWLVWALLISALGCSGLIFYIAMDKNQTDIEMMQYAPVIRQAIKYSDSRLGFSIKHPASWDAEAGEASTVSFLDPGNYGQWVSITVSDRNTIKSLRASLDPFMEKTILLDGEQALYSATGSRNSPEYIVSTVHLGRHYIIRGSGKMFDSVLATFKFLGVNGNELPGAMLKLEPAVLKK